MSRDFDYDGFYDEEIRSPKPLRRRSGWYRRRRYEILSRIAPRFFLRLWPTRRYYAGVAEIARGRFLDMGCGLGAAVGLYALRGRGEAWGIDISRVAVSYARDEAKRHGLRCRFAVGDILRTAIREASFDTVYLGQVLEHVEEEDALIREAIRLLRPGGKIILSVPKEGLLDVSDHLRIYTEESLAALLGGFQAEGLTFHPFDPKRLVLSAAIDGPSPGGAASGAASEKAKPRVYFLIQGVDRPATRYRVLPYTERLRSEGVETRVRRFPDSVLGWIRFLLDARSFDIVFVQKKRLKAWQRASLSATKKRVVFDVDDAVMFRSPRNTIQTSRRRRRQFVSAVRSSDAVIAGNRYLASLAGAHNPCVTVVPTSIDLSLYRVRAEPPVGSPVMLGWIGGRKSLYYLEMIRPALEEIGKRYPQCRLLVLSSESIDFPPLRVIGRRWSPETEARDLEEIDIGLAPLSDDPWSRGKSATKLLQHLAVGAPVVCSPVGAHLDIVREGWNGLFARTEEDWVEKISRLIDEPSERRKMGLRGRRVVEEGYCVDASAPKLLRVIEEVGGRGGPCRA